MNTFYHGDCKFVMNHDIEPNSIDLIYLDPPFFTGKVQKGIAKWQPGAMEVSYEDSKRFWKEKGIGSHAPEWMKHIALTRPDFAAYLFYMMERLQACHKVLKDTGSIYLHCDWNASHYLKMIMDEIFGHSNFKSSIIWYRTNKIPDTTKRLFYKAHDEILFYTKTSDYTFYPLKEPTGITIRRRKMKKINGKITNTNEFIEYERMLPLTKSVISDIPDINVSQITKSSERMGYPTQKPIALLERIIKASSNEGDIILDPFCGCGTAIIAAQRLNRQWIGIDISKDAYEVSSQRQGELPLDFTHFTYVERTLDDVLAIDSPSDFEKWVNGYFKAHKPNPDKGVDGITSDNIPIQTKTFKVTYTFVSKLVGDARYHPQVKQPFDHAIIVSQTGFDDGARQRKFEIETKEGITVDLLTPSILLSE